MRTTTIINQELKQAFDLVDALLLKNPDNQDLIAARQIAEEMSQLEIKYQAVVASGGTPDVNELGDISKAAESLENKFVEIAGKEQAAVMMSASKKRSSLLPGIKIHTADFLGELQKNNPFDLARLAQEVMTQHPELLANDTEKDLVKFVEKAIYPKGMPKKDKKIIANAQQLIAKMNKTGRSLKVNDLSSREVKILENGYRVMSGLVSAMHNKVVVISGKTMVPDVDVAKNNLSELSAMLMAKKNPPKELKGNTYKQLLALEKEIRDEDGARNLKDMATRLILQCAHAVGVLAREANKQQKGIDSDVNVTNAPDIQVEKTEAEPGSELDTDQQNEIAGEAVSDTASSAPSASSSSLTDDEGEKSEFADDEEGEIDDAPDIVPGKVNPSGPPSFDAVLALAKNVNASIDSPANAQTGAAKQPAPAIPAASTTNDEPSKLVADTKPAPAVSAIKVEAAKPVASKNKLAEWFRNLTSKSATAPKAPQVEGSSTAAVFKYINKPVNTNQTASPDNLADVVKNLKLADKTNNLDKKFEYLEKAKAALAKAEKDLNKYQQRDGHDKNKAEATIIALSNLNKKIKNAGDVMPPADVGVVAPKPAIHVADIPITVPPANKLAEVISSVRPLLREAKKFEVKAKNAPFSEDVIKNLEKSKEKLEAARDKVEKELQRNPQAPKAQATKLAIDKWLERIDSKMNVQQNLGFKHR